MENQRKGVLKNDVDEGSPRKTYSNTKYMHCVHVPCYFFRFRSLTEGSTHCVVAK